MRVLVVSNFVAMPDYPQPGLFMQARVSALRNAGADVELLSPAVVSSVSLPRFPDGRDYQWPVTPEPRDLEARILLASPQELVLARLGWRRHLSKRVAAELAMRVKEKPDLIVGHGAYNPPATGIAFYLADMLSVPYVAVAHGSDINLMYRTSKAFTAEAFNNAAAACFVSKGLLENARKRGIHPKNPQVTPNGVDRELFRLETTREPGPPRFLFVGALRRVKGADRLPEIMRHIWREVPDAQLKIVGSGELEQTLRSQLVGKTDFSGFLTPKEVAEAMGGSDILLVPSRSEGFPGAIVEARSTGTAVVGTDVGGVAEAVSLGGSVVPVENGFDAELFAAQTLQMLGSKTPEQVAEGVLSWQEVASRELHLYRGLV